MFKREMKAVLLLCGACTGVFAQSVPNAPTNVTGIPGNARVAVSWTAPFSNGDSITSYAVTASPGGATCFSQTGFPITPSCTVTGLTNGSSYTFTVTATNDVGTGAASLPSAVVTLPALAPGAPGSVAVVPGNTQVAVFWNASIPNGAPVTAYAVTSTPGNFTCSTAGALNCTVGGLTNGTAYTFTVTATNSVGTSAGATSSAATPSIVPPGAPTNVVGTSGNSSVTLTWTAPASNGGSAITSYTAAASPGGATCTSNSGTPVTPGCTMTGLSNDTSYTFTVTATNSAGTGAVSAPSLAVVPATVPGAPTSVVGTPGNGSVLVSWTAPTSNGGSAITSYTASALTAGVGTGFTCTSNTGSPVTPSCSMLGLANGIPYTFIVTATNSAGAGAPSKASAAVTVGVPGAPTSLVGTSGNGLVSLSWTAPASNGGSAITSYTATSSPAGLTCTSNRGTPIVTSCSWAGLTNGTSYTFTVTATNANGTSAASVPSAVLTPSTIPGTPTNVVDVDSLGQASIHWTAPASNGGSVITSYIATAIQDTSKHCSTTGALTCVVPGIFDPTAYTFTVVAINVQGSSPASNPSILEFVDGVLSHAAQSLGLQMTGSSMTLRLPEFSGNARVSVMDLRGRVVWDKTVLAGTREISLDSRSQRGTIVSGIYFVNLFVSGVGQGTKLTAQSRIFLTP